MSSANFNMLPVTPSSKSSMYTKNKIGPSQGWGRLQKPDYDYDYDYSAHKIIDYDYDYDYSGD